MRLVTLLLALSCGDDPVIEQPPRECPEGQAIVDGICQFKLPPLPCGPHQLPIPGGSECAPVGPGPCRPPFESDGSEWGCRAIAGADCPAGTAPILGSPDCMPVGWSDCPAGFALEGGACTDVVTAETCTGATRAALGETGCVPIGDCSAPLPAGAIMVPGDHATIGAAIAAAPDGATIAIDGGAYGEPILIDRPLSLIGRCAELVVVTATSVRVSAEASISGVAIRGGEGVQASADLILSDAVIENMTTAGVIAVGPAAVTVERSAIRTIRSNAAGARGRGASAQQGGSIVLREVHIDDVREGGAVAAGAGSRLSLERSIVTRVRRSAAGVGGEGLIAAFGAVAIASSSLIADATTSAILAVESTIEATDVVLRDIDPGGGNAGVRLEDGSRFTGSRIAIRRATGAAFLANNPGTVAEVSDVVMVDTLPDSGFSGGAFSAQSASLTIARARIEGIAIGATSALDGNLALIDSAIFGGPQSIGVFVQDSFAEVSSSSMIDHEIAGVSVERGRTVIDGALIRNGEGLRLNSAGIDIHEASEARIDRSAVDGVDGQGIVLLQMSSATIADSLVEGVRIGPFFAMGIGALSGSRMALVRARVEEIDGTGVLSENGPLTIDDTAVLRTRDVGPVTPAGLAAGGQALVRGSAFVGNTGVGVVFGAGDAVLDRVLIAGTRARPDGGFGHALVAESATVSVERSALYENASVGAFFDKSRALVDASLIARNAVGVHAQSGSFLGEGDGRDPQRLEVLFTKSVLFVDNQTRVGTGQLPLPNPFEGLP